MRRWQTITATAVFAATASISDAKERPHAFTIRAVCADPELSPRQAAAITSEVNAIWAPLDLQIVWQRHPGTDDADKAAWTIGIDIRDQIPFVNPSAEQPLGAVAVVQGRLQQTIYVSRGKVQQFLAAAGIRPGEGFYETLYGRFVGRVIAHELGHLLFESHQHRERGLMRARFAVRDVLAGRGNLYTLDEDDLAGLRARLLAGAREQAAAADPSRASSQQPHE